ncbi:hypothetical protein IHQ56_02670 [Methylobacillus flagellatus]|uniref:hypothetical protein n=1 Tax=Methylobacillus flagellatus TaxID=405 RepID=UPI002853A63A|nr:hypothetical protein [Methylobacillus flagellatus]MDR5170713.1 hypothetical protein [Methylobacillus flagellatus]
MNLHDYNASWIWNPAYQLNWGNMADWAQVASSMLGLLIAYRLGAYQAERMQYEEKKKLARAAHTLAQHVSKTMAHTCDNLENKAFFADVCHKKAYFDRKSFDLLVSNLQQIPLYQLPTTDIITTIALVQANLNEYIHNIDVILNGPPGYSMHNFDKITQSLRRCSDITTSHVSLLEHDSDSFKKPRLLCVFRG